MQSKCKQSSTGFKLESPIPFSMTITIMLRSKTGASPSEGLLSYPGQSLGRGGGGVLPPAEMHSAYSIVLIVC